MRDFMRGCFWLLVILLVLFLIFSGILWGMASYWWGYSNEGVTLTALIWGGLWRFWYDGPGPYLFGVCAALGLFFLLDWISGLLNLHAKQQAAASDIEKRAAALAEGMRADIQTQVVKAHDDAVAQLRRWEKRLAAERDDLTAREAKVNAYLEELKALRRAHTRNISECKEIRQRGKQALAALSREEPCIGEAKRLVNKIVQIV